MTLSVSDGPWYTSPRHAAPPSLIGGLRRRTHLTHLIASSLRLCPTTYSPYTPHPLRLSDPLPYHGITLRRTATKLATGLRSIARNNKATRLLTRPGWTTKSSSTLEVPHGTPHQDLPRYLRPVVLYIDALALHTSFPRRPTLFLTTLLSSRLRSHAWFWLAPSATHLSTPGCAPKARQQYSPYTASVLRFSLSTHFLIRLGCHRWLWPYPR